MPEEITCFLKRAINRSSDSSFFFLTITIENIRPPSEIWYKKITHIHHLSHFNTLINAKKLEFLKFINDLLTSPSTPDTFPENGIEAWPRPLVQPKQQRAQ